MQGELYLRSDLFVQPQKIGGKAGSRQAGVLRHFATHHSVSFGTCHFRQTETHQAFSMGSNENCTKTGTNFHPKRFLTFQLPSVSPASGFPELHPFNTNLSSSDPIPHPAVTKGFRTWRWSGCLNLSTHWMGLRATQLLDQTNLIFGVQCGCGS